jgi:hypothetical protein
MKKIIETNVGFVCLVVCLILPAISFSFPTWVPVDPNGTPGDPPHITILEHDESHTMYKVEIPGFWCEDVYEGGQTFQKIWVPVYGTKMEIGKPELPVVRGLMGYPEGKETSNITVVSTIPVDFYNYLIHPHQPSYLLEGPKPPFQWNQIFYNQDVWYPGDGAVLSNEGVLRDIMVVNNNVQSFQYNPYYRHLRVSKEMVINIEYSFSGKGKFGRKDGGSSGASPDFIPLYRSCVWNYDYLNKTMEMPEYDYLIITANGYYDFMEELKSYIEAFGHHVIIAKLDQITNGNTALGIYHYINDVYDIYHINYVLLAGDVPDTWGTQTFNPLYMVPTPYWLFANNYDGQEPTLYAPSDVCYACLDNADPPLGMPPLMDGWWKLSDWYPDVYVGRLTADNVYEMNTQINKIINYEMGYGKSSTKLDSTPKIDSTPWYDTMVFIAHKTVEPPYYDYDFKADKIGIEDNNNYDIPITSTIHECWGDNLNMTNDIVMDYIEEGCNIVNYWGHGGTMSWDTWAEKEDTYQDPNNPGHGYTSFYGNIHVKDLSNEHYVVAFNIGCSMACIDTWRNNGETLCDYWMRIPDEPNKYNGAVATNGATRRGTTYGGPIFDAALFQVMYGIKGDGLVPFQQEPVNLLGLVHYGAITLAFNNITDPNYPDTILMALREIYIHILLGEPSMRIRNKYTEEKILSMNKPEKLIKEQAPEVTIYPNPSSGTFTLKYKGNPSELSNIKIYDISGRLIKKIDIPKGDKETFNIHDNTSVREILLDVSDISDGLYIIGVSDKVYKKLLLLR